MYDKWWLAKAEHALIDLKNHLIKRKEENPSLPDTSQQTHENQEPMHTVSHQCMLSVWHLHPSFPTWPACWAWPSNKMWFLDGSKSFSLFGLTSGLTLTYDAWFALQFVSTLLVLIFFKNSLWIPTACRLRCECILPNGQEQRSKTNWHNDAAE